MPKIAASEEANRELDNQTSLTVYVPSRISTPSSKRSAAVNSPASANRGTRSNSTPRRSNGSVSVGATITSGGSSKIDTPTKHVSPAKDPNISPNAKFAAYQNGDYSLSSLITTDASEGKDGSAIVPMHGKVSDIPKLLQVSYVVNDATECTFSKR